MIKKTLTFTDYNGDERTETFYFNLNKAELTELEISHKGGLIAYMEQIVAAENNGEIVDVFKEIIKKAHGVKSDDGRRFKKTDETLANFMETEAYSELFMELVTDADAAAAFIKGIAPAQLQTASAEHMKKTMESPGYKQHAKDTMTQEHPDRKDD